MSPEEEATHTVPLVAKERDGHRFFDLRIPIEDLHPTDDALRALNEDADGRFDAPAVDSGDAIAEVRIDEHGGVVDVDWFDSPRTPDRATVTADQPADQPSDDGGDGSEGLFDRLRSVFR